MTTWKQPLFRILAILALALVTACGDGNEASTHGSDAALDHASHGEDSASDSTGGDAARDSAFFPPPSGDFAIYELGDASGSGSLGNEWLLSVSTDSTSFADEAYALLSFGDASGEFGTSLSVWADLFDPMKVEVRQIEFRQHAALHGVDWWPLGPLDSEFRVTFTEPMKMDFSGQAGGLVSTSGAGEIVWNDGIPVDATFVSTIDVIGRDVTVEVPYGTVERVVKVVMNLTHTTASGSAEFGGTFYLHPDLGLIAADLDGGLEAIALASLAAR
ncbi:MAG: hypothetical protein KJ042_02530 [Deltaproteobacteria bacterium]|nr:hypothetical protein [Deltaproteobacteria bacterium]